MPDSVRSARAAGKVSLAVFLSRILGLVRDQLFAKLFGAGLYNDAWLVAFRIPNLFRDLFAEGALSAAVVPTFTDTLHRRGRAEAWVLVNLVLSGLLVLLGGFSMLLPSISEWFVYLLAAGFSEVPGKIEITSNLLILLSPFLMLVAMASVGMAVLNALNHFFLPALAPAVFNLSLILAGLLLVPRFQEWGILPIYAMGFGALAGGLLQYLIQLPLMRQHGYRFRFRLNWRHQGVRRILRLMAPAIVGVGAVQINVLINTQIASFLAENGPVSWLSYAFRIVYLPIGLFGVAVGVVNLREVSIFSAEERWEDLKETVANSLKLVLFLAIPSAVGLLVLAIPVVRVIFERGGFGPSDTRFTAYALMGYSLGLFAYSCMKVYVPTFYALDDTRTPVRISLAAVGTNLTINLILVFGVLPTEYAYVGLALGTALSVVLSHLLLARGFRRKLGTLEPYGVGPMAARTLLAAVMMGVLVHHLHGLLEKSFGSGGFPRDLLHLAGSILAGAVSYFGLCHLLGVREGKLFFRRLRT